MNIKLQKCVSNRNIALFGGSFNPPHPAHFEMGRYLFEQLGVDEVWFLFSQNWQKDPSQYASLEHRKAMGELLAAHYPDIPFIMSSIQDEIGTHETFDVLQALKSGFPNDRFVWTMGADNLATFHTWKHSEDIIQNFPVAVVDRPPYTEAALKGPTALKFEFLKAAGPRDLVGRDNGWCFLNGPRIDMSSSGFLDSLRGGQTHFKNQLLQEIADYILQHGLFGMAESFCRNPKQDIDGPH